MMLEQIYNYLQVNECLHSAGMPTPEQVSNLAAEGVRVVINLSTSRSEGWISNEQELVEAQGIVYYNIPVDWDEPTTDDLNQFSAIMDRHQFQNTLVHCKANYRATGFIALYRVCRLGWAEGNAFKELRQIWSPAEYPIWQQFIEKSLRAQS